MRPIRLNTFRPTISPNPINFTYATLATQSTNTRNPTHTPLLSPAEWRAHPPMSLPPAGFASDFQSNGSNKLESLPCPAPYTPSLTGLGIRYIEQSGSDSKGGSFLPGFSTTAGDHVNACGGWISLGQISRLKPPIMDVYADDRPRTSPSTTEDIYSGDCNVIYPTSNLGPPWSLASLSAVTAYSSDGSIDERFLPLSSVTETSGREAFSNHDLFHPPMAITPPMVCPFLDINMFEQPLSAQEPPACVNPADTIGMGFYVQDFQDDPDSPCPPSSSTSSDSSTHLDAMSMEAIDSIVSVLSATVAKGDIQASSVPVPLAVVRVPDDNVIKTENDSEHFVNLDHLALPKAVHHIPSPSASTPTSSPFSSPHRTTVRRPKNATRSYVQKHPSKVKEEINHFLQTVPGTPVLDAHRGIELMDLIAKAERYRLRNPGQDLNKKWLASFAGKLSTMGELLDDFRCYVIGCPQKNKRRDHILIHVGSHVDQRPFPCSFCPMRFLRKNEWKRHEASHTGEKPFICSLCQVDQKAFVRQDLLSQHMKRSHGINSSANKENGQRARKKAKLGY